MDPAKYTGRASYQVDQYLNTVIRPILDANRDVLGMTAQINV
jgi:adenylosuccinate lyase